MLDRLVLRVPLCPAEQWRDEVDLLLPDGARRDDWVSTDPSSPGPITVLTHQALAVTDRPDAALREMAREAWLAEAVDRLVGHGVRTVVLDECHHLLDHWAIVLLDLFDRLGAAPGPPLHVSG